MSFLISENSFYVTVIILTEFHYPGQCFPTFFGLPHPCMVKEQFGRIPFKILLLKCVDFYHQRYPQNFSAATRWEPLLYSKIHKLNVDTQAHICCYTYNDQTLACVQIEGRIGFFHIIRHAVTFCQQIDSISLPSDNLFVTFSIYCRIYLTLVLNQIQHFYFLTSAF